MIFFNLGDNIVAVLSTSIIDVNLDVWSFAGVRNNALSKPIDCFNLDVYSFMGEHNDVDSVSLNL